MEEGGADFTVENDEGETALGMKEKEMAEAGEGMDEDEDDDDERENLDKLIKYLRSLVNSGKTQAGENAMET